MQFSNLFETLKFLGQILMFSEHTPLLVFTVIFMFALRTNGISVKHGLDRKNCAISWHDVPQLMLLAARKCC